MIKNISLNYFRKHESLCLNLGEGLQTFRGINEAGKTTILEGAAYSLFGSKALRTSLADTVTWGHKDTELKTSVDLEIDGQTFTFQRSKAGAEVYTSGSTSPFVTGQNEVSAFAASLLGADVNTAHHLMLSGQGGLRGILSEGPKATSGLIETLADLDLIDRIIESATEKLQLGATTVLEERLAVAHRTLAEMEKVEEPQPVDLSESTRQLEVEKASVTACEIDLRSHTDALQVEVDKRAKRTRLEADRDVILKQAEETALDLIEADKVPEHMPNTAGLRAQLDEAEDWQAQCTAWRLFGTLPIVDQRFDAATFDSAFAKAQANLADINRTITARQATIKALEPQISTTHNCPACGQDTSHLEAVKIKQAGLVQDLADARRELAEAEATKPTAEALVEDFNKAEAQRNAINKIVAVARKYLKVNDDLVPPFIEWNGPVVDCEVGPDVEGLRSLLNAAIKAEEAEVRRLAKCETLREVITSCSRRNAEIDRQIAELQVADDVTYDDLAAKVTKAQEELRLAQGRVALLTFSIEAAEGAYREAHAKYEQYVAQRAANEKAVAQLTADIETTQFNNALVKKVRAARPIIANKLWNLVLAMVSTLFSQMRGEASVVAKGKDGFTVNGKTVDALSGSTLDILGLAIRCALVKTFVPACPFLILDEPSAACDDGRSAALIGFVAAAGFKQVILVTHEDISESVSTNLIQL